MKPECSYTRSKLPRYLTGHMFKLQRMRVARHLAACPVCSSELDALRRVGETERFLRDLEPAGGFGRAARSLGSAMLKLSYRPLWILLIVASAAAVYRYVVTPILHDPDLELLDAGAPPPAAVPALQTAPSPTPAAPPPPAAKEASPAAAPLVVAIIVDKEREKEGVRRINEAMKEHAVLRAMRFSDKVREVAGNLTADELFVFFNRIGDAAKITYKRSQLKSAGSELIPVVLQLQTRQSPAGQAAPRAGEKPVEKPVEKPADNPVGTTLKSQGEQQAVPSPAVQAVPK